MSKREDAIFLMNSLGSKRKPFIFIVDFGASDPVVLPIEEAENEGIFYDVNGCTNYSGRPLENRGQLFRKIPVSFDEYRRAFDAVQEHLGRGNSYLVNLTFPTRIESDLTLAEIFRTSRAKYRLLYRERFVVFSPEIFVQISDGVISSHPMKGTIDARCADAEATILSDPKELAEHTTIVDLIRNDLSTVAKQVRVEQFRYVDTIHTNQKELLQVSSRITGKLPPGYHASLGSIVFSLLPAGSVTGAPKKKTVEIIKEVETYERGYYTGVFGLFDGAHLDSGVMIRFIEKTDEGLVYKSGGGITVFSNSRAEYQELIDKVYVSIV